MADLNDTVQCDLSRIPKAIPSKENSMKRLYFARYKDGNWYRTKIIDWCPNLQYCQIYFVDYGNTKVINIQKDVLYSLDEISDVVSHYPEQAVKVRMKIDKIPQNFVEKLHNILPSHEPVTMKCLNIDKDGNYVVELFKRSEPNNILFAVSQSIILENEL